MTIAAWCKGCGRYVWLDERWACDAGHGWDQMSQWYDPDTGQPVTPYWLQQPAPSAELVATPAPDAIPEPAAPVAAAPAPAAAAAATAALGTREAVLAGIMAAFVEDPGYRVRYGSDADILIDNVVADESWGTGAKKVEYEAVLKADESDRTVYFWELLKEKGGGLSFGGVQSESYSTFGAKRSGTKKEVVLRPGGTAMDYSWDYAATRHRIEAVAKSNGWRLKVVLRKKSAQW